jgi:hypothetical protein
MGATATSAPIAIGAIECEELPHTTRIYVVGKINYGLSARGPRAELRLVPLKSSGNEKTVIER